MTTKERMRTALTGGMPDRIPFTTYKGVIAAKEGFDDLIEQGLGFMESCNVYRVATPNVEVVHEDETVDAIPTRVVRYKTPVGELWYRARAEPGYWSSWKIEHMIKDVQDYKVLEFIIRDAEYSPDYDAYRNAEDNMGDTGIVMAWTDRVPIQRLWIEYTGIERLSYDLQDNLSIVEGIMEAMRDKTREAWEIVAESPTEFIWCPDNITGEVVGPPLFRKYCTPWYEELVELMHGAGKRVLCHMDGMMGRLTDCVADTPLDIVEAFTPPPDGDLPLTVALQAWRKQVVSINFPSSLHLADEQEIRESTREILREAAPGNGFVIGVTENIPWSIGTRSLAIIADTINEFGECPLGC